MLPRLTIHVGGSYLAFFDPLLTLTGKPQLLRPFTKLEIWTPEVVRSAASRVLRPSEARSRHFEGSGRLDQDHTSC